jgi:hypothetical protein
MPPWRRREIELKPSTETALLLILGPSLLPTVTFEHADGAATLGIEHGPEQGGPLAAIAAQPDWIGIVAGKDFVLKFGTHEQYPELRIESQVTK